MKNFSKALVLILTFAAVVFAQTSVPTNPIQAVLYRPQTLTTAQKVRARANIDDQRDTAFEQYSTVRPGSAAAVTQIGTTIVNAGTVSHSAPSNTGTLSGQMRGIIYTSSTAAGALCSQRQSTLMLWRGTGGSSFGGFRFVLRFKLDTMQAGQRGFFQFSSSTAAPTNIDPLTTVGFQVIGVGFNTNTGNWQLIRSAGTVAPTVVDLGASFPLNVTDVLEFVLTADPSASSITYKFSNLTTAVVSSGVLTTDLPASTTFLNPVFWMTNNATAAAVAFRIYHWTLESNY